MARLNPQPARTGRKPTHRLYRAVGDGKAAIWTPSGPPGRTRTAWASSFSETRSRSSVASFRASSPSAVTLRRHEVISYWRPL
jgi:hypothetical protein